MKDSDIQFFKIMSIIICLVLSLGVGFYIYNNNIEHEPTLKEINAKYIEEYGK